MDTDPRTWVTGCLYKEEQDLLLLATKLATQYYVEYYKVKVRGFFELFLHRRYSVIKRRQDTTLYTLFIGRFKDFLLSTYHIKYSYLKEILKIR